MTLSPSIPSHGKIHPLIWETRKGFRRHLALSSPAYIKDALNVGYNAHKLILAAANGSAAANLQIHDLLRLQEQKRIISKAQPLPVPRERPRVWPYGEGKKIDELRPRMREELGGSGKRKVPIPVIVATSASPFLRFRKPQSPYLTRVLNDKIEDAKKRGQMVIRMQGEEEIGEAENKWDSLLNKALLVTRVQTTERPVDATSDEISWAKAPKEISQRIQKTKEKAMKSNTRRGDQMMILMEKERQLRDAEKIERRRNRKILKALDSTAEERKQVVSEAIKLTTSTNTDKAKKEMSVLYKPIG